MTQMIYFIQDILQRFGDFCQSLLDKTFEDLLLSLELPIDNIPILSGLWNNALNGLNSFLSRYGVNDYPIIFGLLALALLGIVFFTLIRIVAGIIRG